MAMTERKIKDYFLKRLEKVGAEARKIKYENRRGCPDWMVVYNGEIYLAELKSTTGRLSTSQKKEKKLFDIQGVDIWVLNSKTSVDTFIRHILW